MDPLDLALSRLGSAEEILDHLEVAYDPAVVRVKRLHILQRFRQHLARSPGMDALAGAGRRAAYRDALARAYAELAGQTPQEARVFKVFKDAAGIATVSLDRLRAAL